MTSAATRPNPFPGLRPFEANEDHLFFGRDGQSDEILRRMRRNRFLAVVGTSGSGKSSLIRAGLLPSLHGGLMTKAGSTWRIAIFRPGNDPIRNLASTLNAIGVLGQDGDAELHAVFTETTLRRSALGLIDAARQARLPAGDNLLVVVDQFEELFRFRQNADVSRVEDEAAAFVKLLLEAARQTEVPIYIVITMRSDFIGECARFRDLAETVNEGMYLIPRMTRDQRRQAIAGPVAVGGAQITPRLVNRLLNEVGDNPDQLPILQHALMRTWSNWSHEGEASEPIDVRHYEAVGGLAEALSRHADRAFNELPDERSKSIAEMLFKCLTEKGLDNREVRRPTSVSEICAVAGARESEVIAVIEPFRRPGRSFLMPPSTVPLNAESLIDISHESLIRNWDKLRGWVEAEALSATIYRRVADTAVLYSEGHAGLWRDPDLQVALGWREKADPNKAWAERYHPAFDAAMKFLDESRMARDADALEREKHRRRELRRVRAFAAVLGVAFLIALALFVGGMLQTKKATEQRVLANEKAIEAREQRAEADRQRDKAQDLAVEATNQRSIAIENAMEATRQKKVAEEALKRALTAERKATENAARAEANLKVAQEQTVRALRMEQEKTKQTVIAEQRAQEAKMLAETALHMQAETLDTNQTIESLADSLIKVSTPQQAVSWRQQKQFALSKMGDHEGAIKEANLVLEIDPKNLDSRNFRAYEYILLGRAEEAVKDVDLYLEQLSLYSADGNNKEAKQGKDTSRSSSGYQTRGIGLGMLEKYGEAAASIEKARALAPGHASLYESEVSPDIKRATGQAILYYDGDSYKTALDYQLASLRAFDGQANAFDSALTKAKADAVKRPQSLDSYLAALNWAWLHLRKRPEDYGGWASMAAIWEDAAQLQPGFNEWAGRYYASFQREHKAHLEKNPDDHRYDRLAEWVNQRLAAFYQRLAKVYPGGHVPDLTETEPDARALALEAKELGVSNQLKAAHKRLTEAIELDRRLGRPESVDMLLQRARLRYNDKLKDYAGVREDCNRVLEIAPNTATAYLYLGYTAVDDASQEQHYRKALDYNPVSRALVYLSDLLVKKDPASEEALRLLERSTRVTPEDPNSYYKLAKVQSEMAKARNESRLYAVALKTINTAVAIKNDDLSFYNLREKIDEGLGKTLAEAKQSKAEGYKQAADAMLRTGRAGQALNTYIKSLEVLATLAKGDGDSETQYHASAAARAISGLIEAQGSREKAVEFWKRARLSDPLKGSQETVSKEITRLESSLAGSKRE